MRTRIKTAAFWVIMVLATWLVVEGVSLLGYRAINRSWFSYAKARDALGASAPVSSSQFASPAITSCSSTRRPEQ